MVAAAKRTFESAIVVMVMVTLFTGSSETELKNLENRSAPIFSCVGRQNGNYQAESPICAEGYYYSCVYERAYIMPCGISRYIAKNGTWFSARMVYSKDIDECVYEAKYCPRDPEDYLVLVPPPSEQQNLENTPAPIFSCVGRQNGNYQAESPVCAEGYYYSCVYERAYIMPCGLASYRAKNGTWFTARMVYNQVINRCQLEVKYCPRDPQNYPVPVPPPSDSISGHAERACIDSRSSCVGKANGNYPQCYPDCQSGYYYTCSNNKAYEMPCPLGWYTDRNKFRYTERMVYDPSTDSCQLTHSSCPRATRTVESAPSNFA